jgi:lipid-A-disaccharide synthase
LVNLVTQTRVVPEFLFAKCQPGPMAAAVARLLDTPGEQHSALKKTMALLGRGGEDPGLRAARAVLARMNHPGHTLAPVGD